MGNIVFGTRPFRHRTSSVLTKFMFMCCCIYVRLKTTFFFLSWSGVTVSTCVSEKMMVLLAAFESLLSSMIRSWVFLAQLIVLFRTLFFSFSVSFACCWLRLETGQAIVDDRFVFLSLFSPWGAGICMTSDVIDSYSTFFR